MAKGYKYSRNGYRYGRNRQARRLMDLVETNTEVYKMEARLQAQAPEVYAEYEAERSCLTAREKVIRLETLAKQAGVWIW